MNSPGHEKNQDMRKVAAIITLSAATALGAIVIGGTANAGSVDTSDHVGWIKQATTSYQDPTNKSRPIHYGLQPDPIRMICFAEGQEMDKNPYWILVDKDGNRGFVHRYATAPAEDLRHC